MASQIEVRTTRKLFGRFNIGETSAVKPLKDKAGAITAVQVPNVGYVQAISSCEPDQAHVSVYVDNGVGGANSMAEAEMTSDSNPLVANGVPGILGSYHVSVNIKG